MKKIILFCAIFLAGLCQPKSALSEPASSSDTQALSLSKALVMAEQLNPLLLAAQASARSAIGITWQAGLAPNPILSVEFDEFAGTGQFKGTSSIKSSVGLSQPIITAGKRGKKVSIARSGERISQLAMQLQLAELRQQVTEDFLKVYLLQNLSKIQLQSLELARQAATAVSKRVVAGEAPAIDETRAEVELSSEEVSLRRLNRELESARTRLAASWNADSPEFSRVYLEPHSILDITLCEPQSVNTSTYPEVEQAEILAIQRRQEMALAKAESTPDLQLSTSLSRFRASGDRAFAVGISMELPLFDRRQGRRREISSAIQAAAQKKVASRREFTSRITALYSEVISLREELANVNKRLLPAADRAFSETNRAYEEGERELIDLLDARRTYLDATRTSLTLQHELLLKTAEYAIITGNADSFVQAISDNEETKNQ